MNRYFTALVIGAAMLLAIGAGPSARAGGAPDVEAGEQLAAAFCAKCHAIESAGKSPLEAAPPFRTFHRKWPLENIEEALAEGIVVGHQAMPMFELSEDQISDLIGYLHTLEK